MFVVELQKKLGLKVDGDFGPKTFKAANEHYGLTPEQGAHLFGQIAHETGGFRILEENLKYTAPRLKMIFPKYFPGNLSELYDKNPEKIGNRVYANRMGNGDEASGDGYFFRGRGGLQTTGRANYTELAEELKDPEILTNPGKVITHYAIESAIFFVKKNNLWRFCNEVTFENIKKFSKGINLGNPDSKYNPHGLAERVEWTNRMYSYVKPE